MGNRSYLKKWDRFTSGSFRILTGDIARRKMEGEADNSMIDHLKLLGLVINLVIGAGVAFHIFQKARSTAVHFLKPLALHVVFMNVAIWLLFLNRYSDLNLPSKWKTPPWELLDDVWIILAYIICAGMALAVIRIVSGILERPASRVLVRCYLAGAAILIAGYGLKWLVPEKGALSKVHYEVYDSFPAVFLILEIVLLIRLWRKSAGVADALRARLGKSFAAFYLARYLIIPLFLLVPPVLRTFFFIMFLNAVPVVWLRIFFRTYEERLGLAEAGRPAVGAADLDTFCRTFDISKRERDILGLILAGKSNRDIEQELFISYHTVKNHVYNLFHKLGVKNRFELARFVENRVREAGERSAGNSGAGPD